MKRIYSVSLILFLLLAVSTKVNAETDASVSAYSSKLQNDYNMLTSIVQRVEKGTVVDLEQQKIDLSVRKQLSDMSTQIGKDSIDREANHLLTPLLDNELSTAAAGYDSLYACLQAIDYYLSNHNPYFLSVAKDQLNICRSAVNQLTKLMTKD